VITGQKLRAEGPPATKKGHKGFYQGEKGKTPHAD